MVYMSLRGLRLRVADIVKSLCWTEPANETDA